MARDKRLVPTQKPFSEWTLEEVNQLTSKAQHGDKVALAECKRLFRDRPDTSTFFEESIVEITRERIIDMTLAKDNLLLKDVWLSKMRRMQHELAGDHPSPLEKILCERIATCYLAAQMADMDVNTPGITLTKAEYYDKRAERAHKRHLAAIESLARVRRLALPVQQINIAQAGAQQMNLATNTPTIDAG